MAYSRQVSNSEIFREQALSGFPGCVGIHAGWSHVPELLTLGGLSSRSTHLIENMKIKPFRTNWFVIISFAALGLNIFSISLLAQPVVSYTVSGTPGQYTMDFTVNNTTPGTSGFDIYFFGVLVDGVASSSPSGYYSSYYFATHTVETTGPAYDWPFNNTWIDPTYTALPTGSTRSGFDVSDTDQNAPTSVQYFAFGYDAGVPYTGPGNEDMSSPYNSPLFVGYAVVAVPEPATVSIIAGASLLLLLSRRSRV